MPRVSQTVVVEEAVAQTLLAPRADLVVERPWTEADERAWAGPAGVAGATGTEPEDDAHDTADPTEDTYPPYGRNERDSGNSTGGGRGDGSRRASFALDRGPMAFYRRDVEARPAPDGGVEVAETTRYGLNVGPWSVVAVLPLNRALRRTEGRQARHTPFWAPPDQLDVRAGAVLGVLLTLSLVTGYLGTVLTQTITYAAEDFGRGTTAQGGVLAAVRAGVLGSLVLVGLADRRGRRPLLLGAVGAGCVATVTGALAPNIEVLGLTQTVARGFSTAAAILLAVVAVEEMPAGARAYALSVMAMAGGLGAGVAVWALPLADVAPWGWRLLYVVPVLGIPLILGMRRRLPESRRFTHPHRDAPVVRGHAGRLWALSVAFFCASAFAAPSSQLLNEFLRDERGFSAARISLFTILTSTPAGLALVAGGRLADTRGRRAVVAVGVAGGALLGAWAFRAHGWPMWVANLGATLLAALALPALRAYGPELFPTGARGRANGIVEVVSVTGSAVGLVVAGLVADHTGRVGDGIVWLLPLGLLVGVLALTVFPETARRELEDINPEDAAPGVTPEEAAPGDAGPEAAPGPGPS